MAKELKLDSEIYFIALTQAKRKTRTPWLSVTPMLFVILYAGTQKHFIQFLCGSINMFVGGI